MSSKLRPSPASVASSFVDFCHRLMATSTYPGSYSNPKPDAPDFFGRQNGRARTRELIEHHVAARRAIEKRVGDERDGLHRRMRGERFHAASPEGVDARVGPDVGAIAAEAAQFDIVSVRLVRQPGRRR